MRLQRVYRIGRGEDFFSVFRKGYAFDVELFLLAQPVISRSVKSP